jgi:F-type H+-transporting ATPase subunit epsilon
MRKVTPSPPAMNLKILLPFRIFARQAEVSSIVADTLDGSLGLLPHRLDCVAALVPGILTYSSAMAGTLYVALDGGVLVKSGTEVLISARRAVGGEDLAMLHEAVRKDFLSLSTQEREARAAIAKMEGALLGRLRDFQHAR